MSAQVAGTMQPRLNVNVEGSLSMRSRCLVPHSSTALLFLKFRIQIHVAMYLHLCINDKCRECLALQFECMLPSVRHRGWCVTHQRLANRYYLFSKLFSFARCYQTLASKCSNEGCHLPLNLGCVQTDWSCRWCNMRPTAHNFTFTSNRCPPYLQAVELCWLRSPTTLCVQKINMDNAKLREL